MAEICYHIYVMRKDAAPTDELVLPYTEQLWTAWKLSLWVFQTSFVLLSKGNKIESETVVK